MKSKLVSFWLCIPVSKLRIEAWTETSSEETGSSRSTRSGMAANARAIATLCFSPPLSCEG